jgi:hypothetical protein
VNAPLLNAGPMDTPWQRLRADRRPSSTLVFLLLVGVMAFFTASTLVQFDPGWEPWPAVTGGIFFPALSVILLVPSPARYRVAGLPMRQWLLDHGLLVTLVAVIHLAWPLWAVARPTDMSDGVPAWVPLLPAAVIVLTCAAILRHHRHVLSGQVVGTGYRYAGTPLHYRVFLARRGPVAWRAVYQPVGMTALVAVAVVLAWQTYDRGYLSPDTVTSSFLFAALIAAPVVAASRSTALAVGLPRRNWVLHTVAAIAVPQVMLGAPTIYRLLGTNPDVAMEPARVLVSVGVVVTSGIAAAAFAVSVSFEDWGTAIVWFVGFGFAFMVIGGFGFNASNTLWLNLAALAVHGLLAWCLVSYARGKALRGQPDWTMASIIGGSRTQRI